MSHKLSTYFKMPSLPHEGSDSQLSMAFRFFVRTLFVTYVVISTPTTTRPTANSTNPVMVSSRGGELVLLINTGDDLENTWPIRSFC